MGIIGGRIAEIILQNFAPRNEPTGSSGEPKAENTKLTLFFGSSFFDEISDKVVIDFGCGAGVESVVMALHGAKKVIGIDIQPKLLEKARELAIRHGVDAKCLFSESTTEKADVIISKDAFEHFDHPSVILWQMRRLIKPCGFVLASFGPTWLHPYGGHLFSVFPWAHLIFTEKALIRWRAKFKDDGAKSFGEVAGGLNQMTIKKFERIIEQSEFKFVYMETMPIKGISLFKSRILREWGSSVVRCKLVAK